MKLIEIDECSCQLSIIFVLFSMFALHEIIGSHWWASHQCFQFTVENDAIRKKVIEWGAINIDLTSEIEPSETPSLDDENSEWNTKRCEREVGSSILIIRKYLVLVPFIWKYILFQLIIYHKFSEAISLDFISKLFPKNVFEELI